VEVTGGKISPSQAEAAREGQNKEFDMAKPSEEDSREEKEVKLRPGGVKALLDHIAQTEKLAGQIVITAEILTRDLKYLLEELHLTKLITDQKG